MLLQENKQLKKELASRAWKRSSVGRGGFVAMLVLFALSPFAAFAMNSFLTSTLKPWEYDSLGMLGVSLIAAVALIVTGIAVRIETWKQCNMDIGMREAQEIRIEGYWLTYTYRYVGDRYHFAGGTVVAIVDLSRGASSMGIDQEAGMLAFRGNVRASYVAVLGGGGVPTSSDQMQLVEELHIPNCFIPDLYQVLLPYYRQ